MHSRLRESGLSLDDALAQLGAKRLGIVIRPEAVKAVTSFQELVAKGLAEQGRAAESAREELLLLIACRQASSFVGRN